MLWLRWLVQRLRMRCLCVLGGLRDRLRRDVGLRRGGSEGGRLEIGRRSLRLAGEPLGGVSERTDEVLEAHAHRRGIVEAGDHGLGLGDQLVADLADAPLPLGDEPIGATTRVVQVGAGLDPRLLAKPRGLALDGVEDRTDATGDLRRGSALGTDRGGRGLLRRRSLFLFMHR